jgi:hypothetical protein
MPAMDHISASKVMKQEGIFKRIQEMFQIARYKENMTNNIFAPTAALRMFRHIKE